MTATTPRFSTEQDRKEGAALGKTIERLSQLFPELSEAEVRHAVHGKYADFEQARIRDFVPVLVESITRDALKQRVRQHGG